MTNREQTQLSRRERQIMDVLFNRREADVQDIQSGLPDAPGNMGVRKLLSILEKIYHFLRKFSGIIRFQ